MKLKLRTLSTETLRKCFSQVINVRKFVILSFDPQNLIMISKDNSAVSQEPEVWCKFAMETVFSEYEVTSLRDNVIMLELNLELFLQTLRNFDKAESYAFNIRLKKKDATKTAALDLYYSEVVSTAINHKFEIPVRIIRNQHLSIAANLPRVDVLIKLPPEFVAISKRLEKFKNSMANEKITIMANSRTGGGLKFSLREDESFKVTLSWNDPTDASGQVTEHENSPDDIVEVTVKLRDWIMALKIVGTFRNTLFWLCHEHGCVLHCLLDDDEDVEILYYISGIRSLE